MKEQLILFDTAKLAKEKGFNVYCETSYNTRKNICFLKSSFLPTTHYPAPTQSLLQKWLREEHNLNIVIMTSINTNNKFEVSIEEIVKQFGTDMTDSVYCKDVEYDTYENALEVGLFEALKLI